MKGLTLVPKGQLFESYTISLEDLSFNDMQNDVSLSFLQFNFITSDTLLFLTPISSRCRQIDCSVVEEDKQPT